MLKKITQLSERLDRFDAAFIRLEGRVDSNLAAIKNNRVAIEENRVAIDKNRAAIDKNRAAIEKNTEELHRQGILAEERDVKIDTILDVVLGLQEQISRSAKLVDTVNNHDHRISALETSYKKHF